MARISSDWSGTRNRVRPFRSSRDDRSNSNPAKRTTPAVRGETMGLGGSISRKSLPFNNLICKLDVRHIPGALHREFLPFGPKSSHENLIEYDLTGYASP